MKFLLRFKYTIMLVCLIILAVSLLARHYRASEDCKDMGGVYVKGTWGYECVRTIQ